MEVLYGKDDDKNTVEDREDHPYSDGNISFQSQDEKESNADKEHSSDSPMNNNSKLEESSVSATSNPEGNRMTSPRSNGEDAEKEMSLVGKCEGEEKGQANDDQQADDGEMSGQNTPVNTDRTLGDSKVSDELNQSVCEASQSIESNSKEDANQHVMEKDADEEVDEFFQQSEHMKKFPGLDNVDLASDDEGQDGMGEGQGEVGQSVELAENGTQEDVATIPEQSDDEELSKLLTAKSPLEDYPINEGNYKVCRQVEPGVKECIVLETGEQIKYFTKPKSPISLSSSIIQTKPQSTSSPRNDIVTLTRNTQIDTQQQQSSKSVNSSNMSENYEYLSFPDGSASTIIAADTNLNEVDIEMGGHEQVFITENGIPVILDNAEDDVKINIQAEMDRVSKAIQSLQKSGADLVAGTNIEAPVKNTEDLVGDVLSSGGDGEGGRSHQKDANFMQIKKSKRKRGKQRYYVLQPDKVDNSDSKSESEGNEMNVNNNSNRNDNNNGGSSDSQAEDPQAVEQDVRGGRSDIDINNSANTGNYGVTDPAAVDTTKVRQTRSPRSHGASHYDDVSWSRSRRDDMSDRYSPSVLRGSSLTDSGRYLPSRRSNLYSRYDDSSSSLEASRLSTRYSLLDRGQHNSSPSSSNKQVSWHDMFKMIEEQHRTQQQQQYLEHQRILQEMQESMKHELSRQQDTLKDRLNKYNEMLEELSLGRRDVERDSSPLLSSGHEDNVYHYPSRTTLDGVPISLSYPPPLASQAHHTVHDSDGFEESVYDRTPVKRSLEKELSSPPRPADTSLSVSQVSSLGEDKQLRGGVYSSPMPLAKAKHKGSPKAHKSYDKVSFHHSPREAMPRHNTPQENFSLNAATLNSENADLRQRCQDLEDACHDRKIEIRELTQKIQGLERRAADCSERYETSQSQVVSLHSRLEELTEYAKERDCVAADMEIKAKQSADSLQNSHKREKELTESLHAAKITIRKLVEKYEMMEKDYELLKGTYKDQEESLCAARKENREINSKLSRLELENKQLLHEKDVLKHDLTMARSSPTRTNFEDAMQNISTGHRRSPVSKRGLDNKSLERAYRSSSQERPKKITDLSPSESEFSDSQQSPIIKAEKELKKLRESMANGKDFAPKLQRKFYGTDVPRSSGGYRGPAVSNPSRHCDKIEIPLQAPKSSSPRDSNKGLRSQTSGRRSCPIASENGLTGDQAIERVKTGEIISRPAWEDMYTSMASGKTSSCGSAKKLGADVSNAMREMSLRERLQSIENMERKYDDLTAEKRKYESALSRVRGPSQRRDKERMETELDRVDKELGSIRMSLKRFHVLKSSI